jgi:hypothetical protein
MINVARLKIRESYVLKVKDSKHDGVPLGARCLVVYIDVRNNTFNVRIGGPSGPVKIRCKPENYDEADK